MAARSPALRALRLPAAGQTHRPHADDPSAGLHDAPSSRRSHHNLAYGGHASQRASRHRAPSCRVHRHTIRGADGATSGRPAQGRRPCDALEHEPSCAGCRAVTGICRGSTGCTPGAGLPHPKADIDATHRHHSPVAQTIPRGRPWLCAAAGGQMRRTRPVSHGTCRLAPTARPFVLMPLHTCYAPASDTGWHMARGAGRGSGGRACRQPRY